MDRRHGAPPGADASPRSRRDPFGALAARLAAVDEGTLRAWSLLVTCSVVILFLNTRPDFHLASRDLFNYWTAQAGHLLSHLALGALAWDAFTRTFGHRKGYWLAFGVTSIHAVLDEWVQVYVPSRDANLEDVFTNLTGVAIGIAVMEYVHWRAEKATLRRYRRVASEGTKQEPVRRQGPRRTRRGRTVR